MKDKIMIHTAALGFHEVNKEEAINYVKKLLANSKLSRSCLIEYINNEKLKGTTVQELLGGKACLKKK